MTKSGWLCRRRLRSAVPPQRGSSTARCLSAAPQWIKAGLLVKRPSFSLRFCDKCHPSPPRKSLITFHACIIERPLHRWSPWRCLFFRQNRLSEERTVFISAPEIKQAYEPKITEFPETTRMLEFIWRDLYARADFWKMLNYCRINNLSQVFYSSVLLITLRHCLWKDDWIVHIYMKRLQRASTDHYSNHSWTVVYFLTRIFSKYSCFSYGNILFKPLLIKT